MGLGMTVSDTVFIVWSTQGFGRNKLLHSEQDQRIPHRALGQILELGNTHVWKENQSIIEKTSI